MVDTVYHLLKVSAIVAICAVFGAAILAMIHLIVPLIIPPVITEVFGIISVFTPFDSVIVFETIAISIAGILAFMIAAKIFNLNTKVVKSA